VDEQVRESLFICESAESWREFIINYKQCLSD